MCLQLEETQAALAARRSAVQSLRAQTEELAKEKETLKHALGGDLHSSKASSVHDLQGQDNQVLHGMFGCRA